jgi:peroxiredoxin Q/BCP
MATRRTVGVGHTAPDFTLPDQNGQSVRLKDLLKQGPVVLYFYPRDHTPGCTLEACAFRDAHSQFKDAGATVVGVSDDSISVHQSFASQHSLPFTLLSDQTGTVRELYGVPRPLGIIPGRVTYVIEQNGIVRHVFTSHLRMQKHVTEALKTISELASSRNAETSRRSVS